MTKGATMRSLSASGLLCFTAGAFVRHGDTATFVMLVGAAVGALGLFGWLAASKDRDR